MWARLSAAARAGIRHPLAKPWVWLLCASPLLVWIWGVVYDSLGPNPAEYLIRASGDQTMRMLCWTLCVTPLRVQLGWPELARWRRMLGLWVYAYAVLHALSYSVFDMGLEWMDIARDIAKRPFILVGFSAAVLLTPLAATSFNAAIRWLGAKRWQWLHRAVYLVAPLAVLHFFWMRTGKQNFVEVWFYGVWLAVLLGWRAQRAVRHWRAS